MPSRRSFLGAGALGAAVGLAGCLTRVGLAKTGELQLKAILVGWHHEGRSYRDQVLLVALDEAGVVDGRVDEPLDDVVADSTDIVATDAVHDALTTRFETVEYVLGFCGPGFDPGRQHGCRNTEATRRGFNRVQFGDRAEVRLVDRPGGHEFRLVDVYRGTPADWESEVTTFDFSALHDDHGR